jgi:hypothetical protein
MSTTNQQLDDLTYTMGEALREAWMKGYGEALRQITEAITERKSHSADIHQEGLNIALAIIKQESL